MSIAKKRILYLFTAAALVVVLLASSLTAKAAEVKMVYDDSGMAYVIPKSSTLEDAKASGNCLTIDYKLSPKTTDQDGNAFGANYIWNSYQAELEGAGFNQRSFSYAYEAILLERASQEFSSDGTLTGASMLEFNQFYAYMFMNDPDNPNANKWAEKYKKYKDDGSTEKKDDGNKHGSSSDKSDEGWDAWINPLEVQENYAAKNTVEHGAGIVIYLCEAFGGLFLIWGFVKFVLAMKDDHPEEKQRAMMMLVTGAFLFSLTALLRAVKIIV